MVVFPTKRSLGSNSFMKTLFVVFLLLHSPHSSRLHIFLGRAASGIIACQSTQASTPAHSDVEDSDVEVSDVEDSGVKHIDSTADAESKIETKAKKLAA